MKLGSKHSEEARAKMSANHWSKRGMSAPNKGRRFSAAVRKKISLGHLGQIPWNKGKKATEETKMKLSLAHMGQPAWNKGKRYRIGKKRPPISEATRAKLRESHVGKTAGPNHYKWRGGRSIDPRGYIKIQKKDHPSADKNGMIYEHRFIVENAIGRFLAPQESVHHINEDKHDNRPENLMAFINEGAHQRFHSGKRIKPTDIIFDGRNLHSSS